MPGKKSNDKSMQTNMIVTAVVALLLGWTLGYVIGAAGDDSDNSDAASSSKVEETTHKNHEMLEVDAANAPSVKVLADMDEVGGWNITLVTDNFEFTPTAVNEADVVGTGHAHIWVDGEKVGRVYGNYYHLGSLGEGDHEIMVTLNSNTHKDYAVNGERVTGAISVTEVASDDDHHEDDDHHADDGHHMDGEDDDHSHN